MHFAIILRATLTAASWAFFLVFIGLLSISQSVLVQFIQQGPTLVHPQHFWSIRLGTE